MLLTGLTFVCTFVWGHTLSGVSAMDSRWGVHPAGDAPHKLETKPMKRVQLSQDGRGFVLEHSGEVFHPWGVNYGNQGRLIEDYWTGDWPTVQRDFVKIKSLGYNVARVHLQFGKFMATPTSARPEALEHLDRLLKLADQNRLYLDLTGLACYRKSDVPVWYDNLSEEKRWAAQARFWQAIAAHCARSHAVFCYDLMNEPLSPGGKRAPGQWYSGSTLGGYDFLQFIALDQRGRAREEIAAEWIRRMSQAIRNRDHKTLVTVGMLPWTKEMGYLSGFLPEKVAPEMDFVSVHIYPVAGKVNEALDVLAHFAVGKPVVIEETFPLSCSADELESFLLQSRKQAVGWMGHYNGMTPEEYEQKRRAGSLTIGDAIWESWLNLAIKIKPELVGP